MVLQTNRIDSNDIFSKKTPDQVISVSQAIQSSQDYLLSLLKSPGLLVFSFGSRFNSGSRLCHADALY
jgi:hypothetical protein